MQKGILYQIRTSYTSQHCVLHISRRSSEVTCDLMLNVTESQVQFACRSGRAV